VWGLVDICASLTVDCSNQRRIDAYNTALGYNEILERVTNEYAAIPVGGMLTPQGMLGRALALLAGDAAGLANPVTGAGIAAAVHSGRLAGEAAAAWIRGDGGAGMDFEDELRAVFEPALDRAVARRRELVARARAGAAPDGAALRRGWIAYPEYWA